MPLHKAYNIFDAERGFAHWYLYGWSLTFIIERYVITIHRTAEGVPQNLSEERQMEVNMSYERYRKALIRAAQNNKSMIESVGKSIYVLERTCLDNMINRSISSPIAVAETKEELIAFFQEPLNHKTIEKARLFNISNCIILES